MAGNKFDQDKPMMTLVRPGFIEGVAKAMTFGAKKYGKYDYRKGMSISRILDATMRHLNAFAAGEDIDPDSGISHMYLVASNMNMLSDLMEHGLADDDRVVDKRVNKTDQPRVGNPGYKIRHVKWNDETLQYDDVIVTEDKTDFGGC